MKFIDKVIIFFRWLKLSDDSTVEKCEYCGSTKIDVINPHTIVKAGDKRTTYAAKYVCKKCGAKADVIETWDVK